MVRIMIDPGHGGKDPGAVAHGLKEKDVVLRLGRMVRDELEGYDVEVRLTREQDVFVGLSDRAEFANRLRADLFVSLHCNAGGGKGFESFVYTMPSATSLKFQNIIHTEIMDFLKGHGIIDRGRKRANLAVCRETKMPAILLECLFIDNVNEIKFLRDDTFLRGLAKSITSGIVKALGLKGKATKPVEQTKARYRVLTGTFPSREAAEQAAKRISDAFGYTTYTVDA